MVQRGPQSRQGLRGSISSFKNASSIELIRPSRRQAPMLNSTRARLSHVPSLRINSRSDSSKSRAVSRRLAALHKCVRPPRTWLCCVWMAENMLCFGRAYHLPSSVRIWIFGKCLKWHTQLLPYFNTLHQWNWRLLTYSPQKLLSAVSVSSFFYTGWAPFAKAN